MNLLAAYRDARVAALEAAPLAVRPGECRFGCGRRWQFALSRFGGHATCAVTPEFMQLVRHCIDTDPALNEHRIALLLSINRGIVRRWYQHARTSWRSSSGKGDT